MYNAYTLQLAQLDKEGKNHLSTQLTAWDPVLAVSYSQDSKDNFSDVISSLNYVVLVLIFCFVALAFVVLYNLTNINITRSHLGDCHHQGAGVLRPGGLRRAATGYPILNSVGGVGWVGAGHPPPRVCHPNC